MKKIAVVTGASSGIGKEVAKSLQQNGYQVIGGARRVEAMADLKDLGIEIAHLDVTEAGSRETFIQDILNEYGRIDLLVNSAGYGSFGALEEVTLDEARRQMDVNVFGIIGLIQLILPTMRAQKSGRIINISSLAGQSYTPLGGWYHASKHTLETLSDVLRVELKPFGVDVVVVEPGNTATNWQGTAVGRLLEATPKDSPYRALTEGVANTLQNSNATVADVAKVVLKASEVRNPKIRYQIKFQEKVSVQLMKFIPGKLVDRLVTRLVR
ncbi:oxidoreductase [Lacticaseibacillus brantae]|nr:oxidoreductase [Lacticaseibacillus brantae]